MSLIICSAIFCLEPIGLPPPGLPGRNLAVRPGVSFSPIHCIHLRFSVRNRFYSRNNDVWASIAPGRAPTVTGVMGCPIFSVSRARTVYY